MSRRHLKKLNSVKDAKLLDKDKFYFPQNLRSNSNERVSSELNHRNSTFTTCAKENPTLSTQQSDCEGYIDF